MPYHVSWSKRSFWLWLNEMIYWTWHRIPFIMEREIEEVCVRVREISNDMKEKCTRHVCLKIPEAERDRLSFLNVVQMSDEINIVVLRVRCVQVWWCAVVGQKNRKDQLCCCSCCCCCCPFSSFVVPVRVLKRNHSTSFKIHILNLINPFLCAFEQELLCVCMSEITNGPENLAKISEEWINKVQQQKKGKSMKNQEFETKSERKKHSSALRKT